MSRGCYIIYSTDAYSPDQDHQVQQRVKKIQENYQTSLNGKKMKYAKFSLNSQFLHLQILKQLDKLCTKVEWKE